MILHIAPTPFFSDRGCHIRIAGIVQSLDTLGFDNEVCTYHLGYSPAGITTHRIAPIKGYQKTSAGPSIYKPWADLKLALLTAKHIRKTKPVALHAHLHEGVLIALLCKLLVLRPSLPIVADMQGSLVGELDTYGFFNKIPLLKWPFKILEKIVLSCATQVVCSSDDALEKFTTLVPGSKHKLHLAQDGADKSATTSSEALTALRKQYKLDEKKKCVVYSGALIHSKGLDELKQLLLACKPHGDVLQFLIIGYPTNELQAFVTTHGLENICTLTGRLPFSELNDNLALADVAVDTKNSDAGEGSGKMLNYLASSLPVVAFQTLNNESFLGSNSSLCSTVDEMRQQILTYVADATERQRAAQRNGQRFEKHYSWDVTATQLRVPYQMLGLVKPVTSAETNTQEATHG